MLGALLGGLAGILFPGAGAAAGGAAATGIGALLGRAALPAIGAGLGTLVTGGDSKDAIRNALLMGAGTAALPGVVGGVRESGFGRGITGGLADIFGMAQPEQAASVSTSNVRPRPRPQPAPQEPMFNPMEGQGMTGMEAEARGRMPTTLPSIGEMAAIDAARSQERAAQGFDLAMNAPVGMSLSEATMDMGPELMGYGPGRVDPRLYMAARQPRGFAQGGAIEGPGTGTSDSVPAEIYQDGKPVTKAKLSDGEFVMTAKAVKGAGNGSRERGISRMYELMRRFERGEMA